MEYHEPGPIGKNYGGKQNANQALRLADRGYVLEHGKIVLEDSGENLLVNEDVRKAYLGG